MRHDTDNTSHADIGSGGGGGFPKRDRWIDGHMQGAAESGPFRWLSVCIPEPPRHINKDLELRHSRVLALSEAVVEGEVQVVAEGNRRYFTNTGRKSTADAALERRS